MAKTKKRIELDNKAIRILEKQAKFQKCTLKNYREYTFGYLKVIIQRIIAGQ
jgi:hypothetical protein